VSALLETHALTAYYGDFQALFGIDAEVRDGERVALIGANGAGKSTFLRSIAGLTRSAPDAIVFDGTAIGAKSPPEIAALGIALVPEGRRLFPSLSVEENLSTGSFNGRKGPWTVERVYELFPVLAEKRRASPSALSGGQQQMVAIGRALMANPRLLMCDEVSLGLAPAIVKDVYAALRRACEADGVSVVIVEQDIDLACQMSQRAYCFTHGNVSLSGESAALTRDAISAAYFGV
jgi:branched-chain amino acid transport system ATP-binding protein